MKFTDNEVLHCLNWSYAYLSTLKQCLFILVRLIMEGVLGEAYIVLVLARFDFFFKIIFFLIEN